MTPDPKDAEIARLTAENEIRWKMEQKWQDRAEKAEAERDAALAQVARAYETAAQVLDGECELARIALPQAIPVLWANARAIRTLTPADALAARDRRDAEMRAEGLRKAADLCGKDNGPWEASAWSCRQAILAAAEEEER